MSVSGEFQRVATGCIELLRSPGASGATHWAGGIEKAKIGATDDLERAAALVLDLFNGDDDGQAPSFASELEREEFDGLRTHLSRICRVIVGR